MDSTYRNKRKITEFNIHRKIFVGNVSYRIKSRKLSKFFSKFGPVEYCYIVKDHIKKWSKGIAFITFKDEESMQRAIQAGEEELFFDDRQMRVKPAELSSRATYWQSAENDDDDDDNDLSNDEQENVLEHRQQADSDEPLTSQDSSCLIDSLIDDVLIHIFTMLSWKKRIGVERVCRRWRGLAMKSWSSQTSLSFVGVFRQFQGLTDVMLNSILRRCGQYLHSLDLCSSPWLLSDFSMDIIGKHCPDIKELDLSSVKITDVSMSNLVSKCHSLERVRLKGSVHITDKGISALLNSGQPLIALDLSDNCQLSGKCLTSLQKDIETLKVLTLSSCHKIADKSLINVLKHCHHMEELNINNCGSLTGSTMSYICENCKLKVLNASRVKFDTNSLMRMKNLNSLESLDLSSVHTVSDLVMLSVAEGCKRLRSLNIGACSSVTDTGIKAVAEIPTLESINISFLNELTEESIRALAKAGNLQKLVARATKSATDESITCLVTLCPRLNFIDLSGCFQITNKIFQSFKNVLTADPEKTVDLRLGGTSVDWVAEDVDWMSGFTHLNVSMHNLLIQELQAYGEITLPSNDDEELWEDEIDDLPNYAPVEAYQHGPVEFNDDWEDEDGYNDFLDNDDPLDYERWNMS